MTLLITLFGAIIATLVWYKSESARSLKIGVLALMYWGASIMWFVDAIFEYTELRAEYFTPEVGDMINDSYLGFSVIALGLLIWTMVVLIKDPKGVVKNALTKTR